MRIPRSILMAALLVSAPVTAQDPVESTLEARVWLDRGDDVALQRGDDVRIYYRTSFDAYTAIFRIDTDGFVSLLMPAHPGAHNITSTNRDYRLVTPGAARWEVRDDPGVGYFFIVAATQQLDFSAFQWVPGEERWDLGSVGERVYEDPYLAIDDFVAALIPNWDVAEYTLDFLSYNVGESHDYPRFLCYDCHGYQPYNDWNPYTYACASFRVVIWDDPYFYPQMRYSGTRVVYPVPIRDRPRYTVVARGPRDGWSPITRTRSAPPGSARPTQFKEPTVASGGGRAPAARRPSSLVQPTRATTTRTTTGRTAKPRGIPITTTRSSVAPSASRRPPTAARSSGASAIPRGTSRQPVRTRVTRATPTPRRTAPSGAVTRPTTARPAASQPSRTGGSRASVLRRLADAVRTGVSRGSASRGSSVRRPPSTPARARPTSTSRPPPRAAPSRTPPRSRATPPVRRRGGGGS